jgi:hypothetical protein
MADHEVLTYRGRKFKRSHHSSSALLEKGASQQYSPPPPPPPAHPSRSVLLPAAVPQYKISNNRPVSAKGRMRPQSHPSGILQKLDPISEYRLEFALKHSKPLPPIPDHPRPHSINLHDVDSAVDLDYNSPCDTPIDHLTSHISYDSPPFIHKITTTSSSPKAVDHQRKIGPLPSSSSSIDAKSIQIGLKLPNGDRLQNEFSIFTTLRDIVEYAENSQGMDLKGCIISTNEIPKKVYSDTNQTLIDCGITVRTVLYLSLP